MKVVYLRSFAKDLKKIRLKSLQRELQLTLEQLEQSSTLQDMPNLKKLTHEGSYYRVRIGDYRLGLMIENETVTVVRFLHRRDMYRYFP